MSQTTAPLTVATTILQQPGGNQFAVMTGANGFLGDATTLRFKLPRADRAIKHVRVTLDASDTYTVEFLNRKAVVVEAVAGVYCDRLRAVFEKATGLCTSLTHRYT